MTISTAPTPVTATDSLPWRPLLLLSFGAFWTVTLEMLPAGLLPSMSADLDVRASRVGLLVTVWAVTVGLASIPLTRLTRRWSRPRVLGVALGGLGTATLLTSLAPTYGGVLVTRVVAAGGHGLFWSVLMVYAASLAPAGREGRAISVVLGGPILAGAVGLPLGTALADPLGWRVVVGTVAVAMMLAAPALPRLLPSSPQSAVAPAFGFRDESARRVIGAALFGALALVAHFAVFTFVSPLATDRWGFAEDSVGALLLVFGIAGAVGLAVAGTLGDRYPRGALLGTAAAIAVVFGVLAAAGSYGGVVPVGVGAWGLLLGLLPPLLQNAVIGAASPTYKDAAGAILVATFNLGIATGATSGGIVFDTAGLGWLLPLAVAAAAVSALGLGRVTRRP
jgi:MFS transporter, DHA1 family, inner membrane transport protein